MILKLNPLNEIINTDVDNKIVVTMTKFWSFYFKFLNLRSNNLTDKEIEFLSVFIEKPNDIKSIQQELNIQSSNCYALLKRLVEKELLTKQEDGAHALNFKLQKFVNFVHQSLNKEDMEFDIKFLFKILKTS